jgi:autoinducer 2-degrading protein
LEDIVFVLVVSLKVKPDKREQFLAAALDDSACSVRDEPGCVRFDVIQDINDQNHYYFYEVYHDEAAFQAHTQMPHTGRWRDAAAEVLQEPSQVVRCNTISPEPYV